MVYNPQKIIKELSEQFNTEHGTFNLPIFTASTIGFSKQKQMLKADKGSAVYHGEKSNFVDFSYGPNANPTIYSLAQTIGKLEKGSLTKNVQTVLTSTGLSALTLTISSLTSKGDQILIPDNVYYPVLRYATEILAKQGISVTRYPASDTKKLASLITDATKLILLESPGSLTFEIQDISQIVSLAKSKGIITVCDNSWATPLYHRPLELGVDISIQALTKYIGGGSNTYMGAIIATDPHADHIAKYYRYSGESVSPFDCYLIAQGLQSLSARLTHQSQTTKEVVSFLKTRKEVSEILYPADPDNEFYPLWKSQFSGASSLFSIILTNPKQSEAFVDSLSEFSIGQSWGGPHSLTLSEVPDRLEWKKGEIVRLYIGLEDAQTLIEDLKKGFEKIK